MSDTVNDTLPPRKWYFSSESAIYEPGAHGNYFGGGLKRFDTADNTLSMYPSDLYRYFWYWELPAVTYISPYAEIKNVWLKDDNRKVYQYFPAVWSAGLVYPSQWVAVHGTASSPGVHYAK